MQPELWKLVRDGSPVVATQAALAAAIKCSPLLADFFDLVLRDQIRQFKTTITDKDWSEFIEGCIARDPHVGTWTESVVSKLRQVIFRILSEAGYVADTKSMTLQWVSVVDPLVQYLETHGDQSVLRCMRVMS